MRILFSTCALCLMALGLYLLFDLGASVDAAVRTVAAPIAPPSPHALDKGLRIELVGAERL